MLQDVQLAPSSELDVAFQLHHHPPTLPRRDQRLVGRDPRVRPVAPLTQCDRQRAAAAGEENSEIEQRSFAQPRVASSHAAE